MYCMPYKLKWKLLVESLCDAGIDPFGRNVRVFFIGSPTCVRAYIQVWVCVCLAWLSTNEEKLKAFSYNILRAFNVCVCIAIKVNGSTVVITAAANGNNFLGSVLTLRNENITCYEKLSVCIKNTHTQSWFFFLSQYAHAAFTVVFCRFDWMLWYFFLKFQYLHLCMYLWVSLMCCFFFVQSLLYFMNIFVWLLILFIIVVNSFAFTSSFLFLLFVPHFCVTNFL